MNWWIGIPLLNHSNPQYIGYYWLVESPKTSTNMSLSLPRKKSPFQDAKARRWCGTTLACPPIRRWKIHSCSSPLGPSRPVAANWIAETKGELCWSNCWHDVDSKILKVSNWFKMAKEAVFPADAHHLLNLQTKSKNSLAKAVLRIQVGCMRHSGQWSEKIEKHNN